MPVTTLATRIDSIDNAIRANVRAADGAGGTVALLNSDSAWQVFNISVAKTLLLPSSGVKAGDTWTIENSGSAKLTIQASNASAITNIDSIYTFVYLTALQDAPTTAAHWRLTGLRPSRFQFKFISANYTGADPATEVTALTFNNLVAGRVYRITAAFICSQDSRAWVKHGDGAVLANYTAMRVAPNNVTTLVRVFTSDGSAVKFYLGPGGWGGPDNTYQPAVLTGGSAYPSYAFLEEMGDMTATSAFV